MKMTNTDKPSWTGSLFLCVLLALSATACGPGQFDDLDEIAMGSEPITDGTTYAGHPSVGWLHIGGTTLCTATLVGPTTVLTAAHCIQAGQSHVFYVGSGSYSSASEHPHGSYNATTKAHDIAIVKLASTPSGITPSVISELTPSVGTALTLVGYGITATGATDQGTKRMATNTVATINSTKFRFDGTGSGQGNTCFGDSGGPAFATLGGREVVAGTTVGGSSPCGSYGVDSRVDYYSDWIKTTAGGDLTGTCASLSLAGSPVSGSSVAAGATVALTATATCGTGTAEYAFRAYTTSGGWRTLRGWSTSNTYNWDTTGATQTTHQVTAWVRIQGSGLTYQAIAPSLNYTITPGSGGTCTAVSLASSPAAGSSVVQGTPIDFTATPTCSGGTVEYAFRGYDATTGWRTLRGWNSSPTFQWTTTTAPLGTYQVMVWIRAQGAPTTWEAQSSLLSYTITASGAGTCTAVAVASNPSPGSILAGTTVNLTATPTCGAGTPEYAFRGYDATNGWQTLRGWSTVNTFLWDSAKGVIGKNDIVVWVRIQGSGVPWQARSTTQTWTVTSPPAGTCSSIIMGSTPGPGSVTLGNTIAFTSSAVCGTGTPEYVYRLYNATEGWSTVRPWSTDSSFDWSTIGENLGSNQVMVWVRIQGSGVAWQAQSKIDTFTLTAPAAGTCSAVSLASTPAAGSTVSAGTTINFTATAACGTGTPEYVIRGYTAASGWKTLRPWSTSNTYAWDTTGADLTSHTVMAWVRIQGSGVAYQALSQYLLYTIQ